MEILSREQAKALGISKFFTGRVCKRGHVSPQYVKGGRCVQCANEWSAKQLADGKKTPGKYKPEKKSAYYQSNKERIHIRRQTAAAHKSGMTLAEYWEQKAVRKSEEYEREKRKTYAARDYQKNKERYLANSRKYKAAKKNRVPPWADRDSMLAVYKLAKKLTAETGVKHHVDHIIPINGAMVSGLHCEQNLQILSAAENLKKSNIFHPDKYLHNAP